MKKEIPDFILELGADIEASPNRSTEHPFWQVRHLEKIVTAEGYDESGFWVVFDDDEYSDTESFDVNHNSDSVVGLREYIKENHSIWFDENEKYLSCGENGDEIDFFMADITEIATVVFYQEVERVVWTGLSEADAIAFIKRKQHDYPKLYTYVESAYWSPRMAQLMNWIKEISKE